jgi:hypothetical protein
MKVRKYLTTSLPVIAILAFVLTFMPLYIGAMVTAGICLAGILFFRLNSLIRSGAAAPNPLKDLRRNFEYLLLGSTKIWMSTETSGSDLKLLPFAFYRRTLYADFLILQRMFSFLKEGGCAVVTVECSAASSIVRRSLTYADLQLLHRITLTSLGIRFSNYQRRYPLFFYPVFSAGYLVHLLQKRCPARLVGIPSLFRRGQTDEAAISAIIETIGKMAGFCEQRSLKMKVVLLVNTAQSIVVSHKVKEGLTALMPDIPVLAICETDRICEVLK